VHKNQLHTKVVLNLSSWMAIMSEDSLVKFEEGITNHLAKAMLGLLECLTF